jgi:hypothetical protein
MKAPWLPGGDPNAPFDREAFAIWEKEGAIRGFADSLTAQQRLQALLPAATEGLVAIAKTASDSDAAPAVTGPAVTGPAVTGPAAKGPAAKEPAAKDPARVVDRKGEAKAAAGQANFDGRLLVAQPALVEVQIAEPPPDASIRAAPSDTFKKIPPSAPVNNKRKGRRSLSTSAAVGLLLLGGLGLIGAGYVALTLSQGKTTNKPNRPGPVANVGTGATPPNPSNAPAEPPADGASSKPEPVVPASRPSGLAEAVAGKFDLDVVPQSESVEKPIEKNMPDPEKCRQAMQQARQAMLRWDFEAMTTHIQTAHATSGDSELNEPLARLVQATQLYQIFVDAVRMSIRKLKGGDTFRVMNTEVAFVEADSDRLVIRASGQNQRYALVELPPGVALGLADLSLSKDDSVDIAARGVFFLLGPKSNALTIKRGKELIQEVLASDKIRDDLLMILDDK